MAQLTIIMPSYNKGRYISEALDSVLMQKTEFTYQIVVADDASTDETISIVSKYTQQYPNKILLLKSSANQGLFNNILRVYKDLKSEFFCVLDPDDYWISQHKIQNALSFLKLNTEYSIYCTNTRMSDSDAPYIKTDLDQVDSTFDDYLVSKAVLGCSLGTMYRNIVFSKGLPEQLVSKKQPQWERAFRADSFRNILHLHEGKAHFVNTIDATYRITKEGLWQGSNELERSNLNALFHCCAYDYFDKKYPKLYNKAYWHFTASQKLILDLIAGTTTARYNKEDLEDFLQQQQRFIKEPPLKHDQKISVKNRIRLYVYKKLQDKLKKKQLI